MTWVIGESLDVEKLAMPYAVYRTPSAGQSVPNNTVTNVQFATAVSTSPYVTAGGTGNNQFTLTAGLWLIQSSYRAGGAATDTRMYLFTGATHTVSTTFEVNEGRVNVDIAGLREVPAGTTEIVCVGVYQNSGGARTVDVFGQNPSVKFVRLEHR